MARVKLIWCSAQRDFVPKDQVKRAPTAGGKPFRFKDAHRKRGRYVWDAVAADWIEVSNVVAMRPRGPLVMRDIDPYRSMRTGEMIGGRRQHRDHLKAYHLVEVGNEMPKPERATLTARDRVDDIKRVLQSGQPAPRLARQGDPL